MLATVAVEFPSLELCHALSIFNLGDSTVDSTSDQYEKCSAIIAKAANVEVHEFRAQFEGLQARTQALARRLPTYVPGGINKSAWHEAIVKIQRHHITAEAHPVDALLRGLILYFVFGVSSSGLEQYFGKSQRGYSQRQRMSKPETEEVVCKTDL